MVRMMRDPSGVDAIRRMGAGAKIISVSMIRCELVLSGIFEYLFDFAMISWFLQDPLPARGTSNLVGDFLRTGQGQSGFQDWRLRMASSPLLGKICRMFSKMELVLLFLHPKLYLH